MWVAELRWQREGLRLTWPMVSSFMEEQDSTQDEDKKHAGEGHKDADTVRAAQGSLGCDRQEHTERIWRSILPWTPPPSVLFLSHPSPLDQSGLS